MLGAAAAQRLGIDRVYPGERIWLGGMWFYVAGILNSAALAPEIDSSVLVGFPAAEHYLGLDGHPTTIYVRTDTSQTARRLQRARRDRQPRNPQRGRRQPALRRAHRRADAKGALNGLFLGLGAVSLLVGAVGVANIMIISVLERRSRDRPSPRARRDQGQHPHAIPHRGDPARRCSAAPPASPLGALATAIYANTKHWTTVIPTLAWAGGLGAAFAIGAIAGLLPAIRAARLSPTDALRTV